MKRFILAVLTGVALTGCSASSQMQNYVGGPLINPVLKNGQPVATYDMGDGTRAFVWDRQRSYTSPTTATSSGSANVSVFGNTANIYGSSFTTISPSSTSRWSCNYVLFAEQTRADVDGPAGWTVVGFQKPDILCE